MAEDQGSKTEKATPKKRRDQRKEGNVFQSKDVATVITLFGSFYVLKLLFPGIYRTVRDFMIRFIGFAGTVTDKGEGTVGNLSMMFLTTAAKIVLPLMLVCMLLGILGSGIQTRFLFSAKSFRPKFSRLNPMEGIKKLFSLQNIVELLKSILKAIILISMVWSMMKKDMVLAVRTMDMDLLRSGAYMLELTMELVIRISMAFLVIAGLDFLYQWWNYERKLMMSKQEVKEEYKQTEGNPQIKGKIRSIQQQRARQRMMQAVPGADVVVRNPTHFAVALKYDAEKYGAPVVLAKGQDELALRIVKVAEENNVAVVENPPLARGIYASTELGQEISQEFYGAVAEVLVYVYKLNKKME
ncbi:MAG: flagellar biosynthesis protein FlhB [Lachnospiraceae bacterium]|nr:flagellar biosynthesis protein FlhB [Lachnospiraceae bacterium]